MRKTLLILCGFLLIFGLATVVEAATYEVSFEPELDGFIKVASGAYSSHSWTDSVLWLRASTNDWRSFVEWNISAIPTNANILDVSFTVIGNAWNPDSGTGKTALYGMDLMPSAQADDSTGAMAIFNAIDDGTSFTSGGVTFPGNYVGDVCMMNDTDPGGGVHPWAWVLNPAASLEENLSRGWYALGIKRVVVDTLSFRSSEYVGVTYKPMLWVKYEMTAPIVNWTDPADYDEDVNLTPRICANITHPLGNSFNVSWYWWDGADWQPFGKNGSLESDLTFTNYSHYKNITLHYEYIEEAQADFPIWIYNKSDDLKDTAHGGCIQPDGDDIMFYLTDNTTKLDHEIEFYNGTTGELGCWVSMPNIYATTDSYLLMYYGNPSATYQQDPAAVWWEYVAVYHCNDTALLWDSTLNGHTGVKNGYVNASWWLGPAISLNRGGYFVVPDHPDLRLSGTLENYAILSWFNLNSLDDYGCVVGKVDTTANNKGYKHMFSLLESGAVDMLSRFRKDGLNYCTAETADGTHMENLSWLFGVSRKQVNKLEIDISRAFYGTQTNALAVGINNDVDLYIGGQSALPAQLYPWNGTIDEVRIVNGTLVTWGWCNVTFNNTNMTDVFESWSAEMGSVLGLTNGTYCQEFANATDPCTTYYWWIHVVDSFGNYTDEVGQFTTHCVNPPTDLTCNRWNTTTLNITFTPDSDAGGESWTEGYYTEGTTPPAWGSGTYFNTTNESINITDLDEGTCYAFSFWTNWNESGNWTRSSARATTICCTTGGNWRFCLRYEERNQIPINLSDYPCSTHVLTIHMVDGSRILYALDEDWYIENGNSSCLDVALDSEPLFFELWWNQSTSSNLSTCNNYSSTSYVRTLLPEAAANESGTDVITFYIMTERRVYGDEYYLNGSAEFEYDMPGKMVRYTFQFDDRTHIFDTKLEFDSYATFYFYNTTDKIIVHQQYWDAAQKVYPVLFYEKPYWTGVNCSAVNDEYENIGLAPNHDIEQETIIIYLITEESIGWNEAIDLTYDWMDAAAGLWILYEDNEFNTEWVNVSIYLKDGNTLQWSSNQSANEWNFTWAAANQSREYVIVVTIKHGNAGFGRFEFPIAPGTNALTNAAWIDSLFYNVLGAAPLYNVDTGMTMVWSHVLVLSVGIILGCLIVYNATLGILAPGIWLVVSAIFISGLPIGWIAVGFLIITMGIAYALYGGGK